VLITGPVVNVPFHERLLFDVKLPKAVEYYVAMDVAAPIVTVPVGADKSLVARKTPAGKFHPNPLCPLRIEQAFLLIFWIET
jgi:hypothetical protein